MTDESVTEKNILKRTQKKLKSAKVDSRSETDKEIDAALDSSSIQEKKTSQQKRRLKKYGVIAGILFLGYFIHLLAIPAKGSMTYAVCRNFLELNVPYPTTLRLSTVEEFDTSVRIWFVHIDPFGEYHLQPIQCFLKQDEKRGTIIDKITIDRREVDAAKIEAFNRILPAILKNKDKQNLDLPSPLPDSLQDLNINTDAYRKQIF